MSGPRERTVEVGGESCRIQEKGIGEPLGYLAGPLGLPAWTPFLERLAASRRVIVPSLPGFPGGGHLHAQLDSPLDWLIATLDLLDAAGLEGTDLIGASIGGALAAETAAVAPARVRRLVLVAPLGVYDDAEPVADIWSTAPGRDLALLSERPEELKTWLEAPDGVDALEWRVEMARARESAARYLWPTTDTGLIRRLHRVSAPTLLLWGSSDRVAPASYAKRFADALGGDTQIASLAGAGHLADFDAPEPCAEAVLRFLA